MAKSPQTTRLSCRWCARSTKRGDARQLVNQWIAGVVVTIQQKSVDRRQSGKVFEAPDNNGCMSHLKMGASPAPKARPAKCQVSRKRNCR
jgi:hypothetical protein